MDIKKILQTILPERLRGKLLGNRVIDSLNRKYIIKKIKKLYGNIDDIEMVSLIKHLDKTGGVLTPGGLIQDDLIFEYLDLKVEVLTDESCGLKYVCCEDGKKLYYPRNMQTSDVIYFYRSQLLEQDKRSGHCYFKNMDLYPVGGVFVDLGAAEGNFSLRLVERAKHIYIFECDAGWIEALEETFKPWKEKVTIVNKFVSDQVDETKTTLSHYFKDEPKIDVVKMDIEGEELNVIKNSLDFLMVHRETKLVMCAYHRENDEYEMKKMLQGYQFREQGWSTASNRNKLHPYIRRILLIAYMEDM